MVHHLLFPRLYIIRKLEWQAEPRLKPRPSDMGCKSPKWCFNHCAPLPPFPPSSDGKIQGTYSRHRKACCHSCLYVLSPPFKPSRCRASFYFLSLHPRPCSKLSRTPVIPSQKSLEWGQSLWWCHSIDRWTINHHWAFFTLCLVCQLQSYITVLGLFLSSSGS